MKMNWYGGLTVLRPGSFGLVDSPLEVQESKRTWWKKLRPVFEGLVFLAVIVLMLKAGVLHIFFLVFGVVLYFGGFLK